MWRTARALFLIVLLAGGVYVYREQVETFALQAYREALPCSVPLSYRIGSIDPRFNLSTSTLLSALDSAASLWEEAAGKTLFVHDQEGGDLIVSLVYDVRQETTEKLRELGLSVDEDLDTYENMKQRYLEMFAAYESNVARFESLRIEYERDADAYERDVEMWNARGGAPSGAYEAMKARQSELSADEARLRALQETINSQVSTVNALAHRLNTLAHDLNISVAQYNTVGDALPGEFEQAVYESRPGQETIRVFEYDSTERLTRVLTHELGHALGLEHVEDENAVMYRLNESKNENLTETDISALEALCRLSTRE